MKTLGFRGFEKLAVAVWTNLLCLDARLPITLHITYNLSGSRHYPKHVLCFNSMLKKHQIVRSCIVEIVVIVEWLVKILTISLGANVLVRRRFMGQKGFFATTAASWALCICRHCSYNNCINSPRSRLVLTIHRSSLLHKPTITLLIFPFQVKDFTDLILT